MRPSRLSLSNQPFDEVLLTLAGRVPAAEQITWAPLQRRGPGAVFVPHYALSGGALMALIVDWILANPTLVLETTDHQLGGMPQAFISKAVATISVEIPQRGRAPSPKCPGYRVSAAG